jgi:hypothetical protein
MRQQYFLGKLIRQKFSNILNNSFKSTQITAYASSSRASVMSAMSQILGIMDVSNVRKIDTSDNSKLYMPPSVQNIGSFTNNEALPVFVSSVRAHNIEHDYMFNANSLCPELIDELNKKFENNGKVYKDVVDDMYKFLQNNNFEASKYSDSSEWTLETSGKFIEDYLSTFWIKNSVSSYNVLSHFSFYHSFLLNMRFFDQDLNKSLISPLLKEWINIFLKLQSDVQEENSRLELKLFSSDVATLVIFLNSILYKDNLTCLLNFYNFRIKDQTFNSMEEYQQIMDHMSQVECAKNTSFASNVIVEIYQQETPDKDPHEDLAVNVYYNNRALPQLSLSLEDFQELLQNHYNSNFGSNCGAADLNKVTSPLGIRVFAVVAFLLLIIMMILVTVMIAIRKDPNTKKVDLYTTSESKKELIEKDPQEVSTRRTSFRIMESYNYSSINMLTHVDKTKSGINTQVNTMQNIETNKKKDNIASIEELEQFEEQDEKDKNKPLKTENDSK